MSYLILTVWLLLLGFIYLKLPDYRIITAILIGVSYFIWGLLTHRKEKTLFMPVVLEYLAVGLLGIMVLIFISIRA
jgi:hypothetical protein